MPISHDLRCIFVHIPKTGGTSVEKALGIFGDWRTGNRDVMFGQVANSGVEGRALSSAFLQHLTAAELKSMLTPEVWGYFKFTIVRNPWEKLLSVYFNKDPNLLAVARANGLELKDRSFDDFVAMTIDFDHAHLKPQRDFIVDESGMVLVDLIGRMESLASDFAAVCDRIGADVTLPRENASQHEHYRSYYSPYSRRLVEDRYAADIEMFGYGY